MTKSINFNNVNENNPLITPDTNVLFNMKDTIPVKGSLSYRDPLSNAWEKNNLSRAFFSNNNVALIQNKLIDGVYKKSNNKIIVGKQDPEVLDIIMHSIYLQYGKNTLCNTKSTNDIVTCGEGGLPMSSWLMSSIAQTKPLASCDTNSQVEALNNHVLDYAIQQVYTEALSYLNYKKDINKLPTPIAHPISTDYNDKQLQHFKPEYGDFFKPQNQ
tara:strand:+ start:791 stop:1435 length:645 start_codon:yes stop_codon:yes gene_type:complete